MPGTLSRVTVVPMHQHQHGSISRTLLEILILAALYVATARLGQQLAIPPGNVTPVWIPSGIVIAALLLRGSALWPGIWLGAFIGNVWAYLDWENFSNLGVSFISGTMNGVGDTLGALVAVSLISRISGTNRPFDSVIQVGQFVLFAAILSSAISAVFGVTGLTVVGFVEWSEYMYVWVTWWVGDGVGVILLTPFLLCCHEWLQKDWLKRTDFREFFAFLAVLAVVSVLALDLSTNTHLPLPLFMVLPVLLWSVVRFDRHISVTATVLVSALAIGITAAGGGPFSSMNLNQALIELQLFTFTISATVLLLLGMMAERKQVENSLDLTRRDYDRVFDMAAGGIVITDESGCIESFNKRAEKIFGFNAADVVGRNVSFLLPIELKDRHQQYLDKTNDFMRSAIFGEGREVQARHHDGYDFPIKIWITESRHDSGHHYMAVIYDITEKKQLDANLRACEQRFNLLADASFEALLIIDNNVVVSVNEQFQSLFGYTPEELVGKPLKGKLFTTDLVFIEGQGDVIQSEGINKLGRRFPVEVQQKSERVNSHWIKVISIRDLTEVKKQQQALEDALNQALNASIAKSKFLSSMSHELRTPMNAVVGFAQLLDMGSSQLTPRQRESVKEIRLAGKHLLSVIDDILDLAKIEAGTFVVNCENVNVNSLVADCIDFTKEQANKRGIKIFNHLSEQTQYLVHADIFRLKQVLLNLLSNAVKFNHADGTVAISAEPTTNNRLRISVTDSGVGLTEAEQDLVFEPFERASAESSSVKGTGIGLVISKSLIELMDGAIGLESYKYMGSTFWVELPLVEVINQDKAEETIPCQVAAFDRTRRTAEKKILYIEDEPANIKLLEHLIDKLSVGEFYSAANGAVGLEIAREHQPDLIILDINMPGMKGYEVLAAIKQDRMLAEVPVIALSSRSDEESIEKGMRAGFLDYITKPVDLNKLSDVLRRVLGIE